jgi:transposase-like protein
MTMEQAIDAALPIYRAHAETGGIKEIAKRAGVSRMTLYRRCQKLLAEEKARTPQGDAPTLNPSETNLSGIEPKESTSNDQSGDKP